LVRPVTTAPAIVTSCSALWMIYLLFNEDRRRFADVFSVMEKSVSAAKRIVSASEKSVLVPKKIVSMKQTIVSIVRTSLRLP